MAENRCHSPFLPPTNQIFQQTHTNNNYNQIPITQQHLTQNQSHSFRDFHLDDQRKFDQEQQRRIWVEQQISSHYQLCRERVVDSGVPNTTSNSLPFFPAVNFSLGHNGDNGKGAGVSGEVEDDDLLMRGSEQQYAFESRNSNLAVLPQYCWNTQEDSSIKQPPFWRPLFVELLNGNNKRCKEADDEIKEEVHDRNQNKHFKCSDQALLVDEPRKVLENRCRLSGDLEAIYGGSTSTIDETNQICPQSAQESEKFSGHEEEEEEDTPIREHANTGNESRENSLDSQMESMASFFKTLVDRIMDHQESLHRRFLETIERLDGERREREEAWRVQELARLNQEAISRAHDQALTSSREATIISYLEKLTGQSIILSNKVTQDSDILGVKMNKRWPKVEVEALIGVRTSLEPKFQDAALKAFVWEEISKIMTSMGYRRSAQRCKEKWENINRYFKKAKENSELQCPKKHKTCPYFEQLDQFHSTKSFPKGSNSSSPSPSSKLQRGNNFSIGNFKEIQQRCNVNDKEFNHQFQENKNEEEYDDEDEEEDDEGSADD